MIVTRKEKTIAVIIVVFILAAWIGLAWITKSGGFKIFADVIKNPDIIRR